MGFSFVVRADSPCHHVYNESGAGVQRRTRGGYRRDCSGSVPGASRGYLVYYFVFRIIFYGIGEC